MNQRLCKLFFVGVLSLAFSGSAFALSDAASPNGGSDSCGLGWQVMQGKTLVGTLVRGTTGSVASPTFSMTSGTSGCDKHTIAKNDQEAVKFASVNFHMLRADMAQGQGEYVDGLARVMGCDDQAVQSFGSAAQKNFKNISNGDAYEMIQNVRSEIRSNPALAAGCSVVI